jgi:threonine dehydrogenase-like Zn-dependent dehydrogenase
LKVTGSTVCGSDLHLLHGTVIELEKGDILGHEFCGVVESMGAGVKNLQKGQRVVASFQIACGAVCDLILDKKKRLISAVFLLQKEAVIAMRKDKL